MASAKLYQPWVPFERVESIVQIEPALFVLGLAITVWLTSKIFFNRLSEDRQVSFSQNRKNLRSHTLIGMTLFIIFQALNHIPGDSPMLNRVLTYLGLTTIFFGSTTFVKASRILAFEYFYFSHRNVAFPVLLVNLITLFLCMLLGTWMGTEIFSIQLAPVLATSAVFSLVLGLALQDTLGNLFAGVTLQFDKPYGIGNWIEVHGDSQKWVGKVSEISWRSTTLISFTEEIIIVPNRVMAQAKISNFSIKDRPIIRSQIFRLPFGSDIQEVKSILIETAKAIALIRKKPAIEVFILEMTESWVGFKLIYHIDDYGRQFRIADQVHSLCIEALERAGYELASHRLSIEQEKVPATET